MRTKPTNNGTLVGLEGFRTGPPKRRQRFYRECKENIWAPCRGRLHRPLAAAVPPPLFTSNKREASLDVGNRGIQKCDSVDTLSLVIKCLGGGGYELGDLLVPFIDKEPSPSGGQVNTLEGKTTAVIAVMRGNPKDGYTHLHSNKHCKQRIVRVLLDRTEQLRKLGKYYCTT
jgi:hypothetical protein